MSTATLWQECSTERRYWLRFFAVLCPVNLLLAAVNAIVYQEGALALLGIVAAVIAGIEAIASSL
jgi:hypothetical protein